MGKAKSAKRNKRPGKPKDLPAKAKRVASVRGGVLHTVKNSINNIR